MSLHDDYARRTPLEIAFPDPAALDDLVERVGAEAGERGVDPMDPYGFVTLGSVASFVSELQGPDADPEARHQYGALVYHAVHFRDAGAEVYLLEAAVTRYLVEGAPAGEPGPPGSSGYLQLPQHLFWMTDDTGAPLSIDGAFWTVSRDQALQVLLVGGVQGGGGFATVPLPAAPLADAPAWLDVDGRGDGSDYSSSLPGAELDGLYEVASAGEVLKLLARVFAYVASVPRAKVEGEAGPAVEVGPEPSALPFHRVVLNA